MSTDLIVGYSVSCFEKRQQEVMQIPRLDKAAYQDESPNAQFSVRIQPTLEQHMKVSVSVLGFADKAEFGRWLLSAFFSGNLIPSTQLAAIFERQHGKLLENLTYYKNKCKQMQAMIDNQDSNPENVDSERESHVFNEYEPETNGETEVETNETNGETNGETEVETNETDSETKVETKTKPEYALPASRMRNNLSDLVLRTSTSETESETLKQQLAVTREKLRVTEQQLHELKSKRFAKPGEHLISDADLQEILQLKISHEALNEAIQKSIPYITASLKKHSNIELSA